MKKVITLCILLSASAGSVVADTVQSSIHSVEETNGSYLIKFQNGRVAFSSAANKKLSMDPTLISKTDLVEAKVDSKQNLISIKSIGFTDDGRKNLQSIAVEPPAYEPTLIANYAAATAIFNRLNSNYKRSSECSNRAHVWASEEFKKNGIKSQKAFVFFTASYINRHRFKWWFHVAPALAVNEGRTETRVLDYMFNRRPLTVKEWTDQFVFSKRACLPLIKFSDYDLRADQSQDCYVRVDSMYNWMPADFQAQEQGRYKTQFSQGEINAAYSEAF